MAQLYLHHIDFCLANDYPSNDFIRENFVGRMEEFGIHLDEGVQAENVRKLVLLGSSVLTAKYNEYSVGEIFVKHETESNIIVNGNAFVMVDAFDNSVTNVYANDRARICVNVYGNARVNVISQDDEAHVKINKKNKTTY